MRTREITRMIQDAVADEQRTGRLGSIFEQLARQHGAAPTRADVQGVVQLVREYVEHVPVFLEQGASAARQVGLTNEVGQMLQELEAYWFETNDLIPDHLGLAGLMDDAYATLLLLQSLSNYCQATFGRPLLEQDLTAANQGMRGLIGDPVVSVIEQRVGVTVANAMMQRALGQIAGAGFSFRAQPDPIWGNASIDDIVTTRLGAMGVV
jgi:hypothetical protein